MSARRRSPLQIPSPPHLSQHHFAGSPVLPAVLALQVLAAKVRRETPPLSVAESRGASFLRFLPTGGGDRPIDAHAELEQCADGSLTATLITVVQLGPAGITRAKEHLRVTFGPAGPPPPTTPEPDRLRQDGDRFALRADDLYRELVPFGPAFHNAVDPIWLTPAGAVAGVAAPVDPAFAGPLGSPYPLDAAMHVACAWGQRHTGKVVYPVGYGRRWIHRPTAAGETYRCVIAAKRAPPGPADGDSLVFDLWILGDDGTVSEVVEALQMKDLSRGRLRAPSWVREGIAPLPEDD